MFLQESTDAWKKERKSSSSNQFNCPMSGNWDLIWLKKNPQGIDEEEEDEQLLN